MKNEYQDRMTVEERMDEGTDTQERRVPRRGKKDALYRLTAAGMLIALEVILAFTPLGYLKIGLLSITFMTIPVIIGSLTTGATAATILGLTFGITSFVQCFGMDAFGTTLFQISPVFTFITCVGTRTLMGFLCGAIYKGLKKTKLPETLRGGIAAFSAPFLNTVFFMACLIGFFWRTEYIQSIAAGANVFKFLITIVGINGIVEWIVCTVVGTAVGLPVARAIGKAK